MIYFCVFSSLLIVCISLVNAGTIRYCIPNYLKNNTSSGLIFACNRLYKTNHEVQCIGAVDRLACFRLLSTGQADFMVAQPEDLKVMKSFSQIVITHELKKFSENSSQRVVEMVAIIKNEFNVSRSTYGKKLCYIGLETNHRPQYDYYYTTYFESWLFPRSCHLNITVLENRILSLSKHFQSACIAGPWSLDRKIDVELKAKYKNLCALCSNPVECNEHDRFYGTKGALTCLRQGKGDLAWLSKSEASLHYAELESQGYALLCPDGVTVRLTDVKAASSCTWIEDPRPVIVANRDIARIVHSKLSDKGRDESKFYEVIHTTYKFSYLNKLKSISNVKDYLIKFRGYFSASVRHQSSCHSSRNIRWCIASKIEESKCKTLQSASNALQISPSFSCVKMHSRHACIRAISNNKSDIFVADPSEEYEAKKLGLKSIIEMMISERDESNTVAAIVRKKSSFKNFVDLKHSKACFSRYKSVGWNAVYSILKNTYDVSGVSDVEAISNFFNDSCVFDFDTKKNQFPKRLNSACKHNNSSIKQLNVKLKMGTDEKTFKCLENGGDVAFMNLSFAKIYSSRDSVFHAKYKVLCPTPEAEKENLCFLAKISLGSVLIRENISNVIENDTYLMFLALHRYFGRNFDRETPMFQMYQPYDGISNVIFSGATMKLQRTDARINYGKYSGDLNIKIKVIDENLKSAVSSNQQQIIIIFMFSIINVLSNHYFYILFF